MIKLCDDIPLIEQLIGNKLATSANPGFVFGRGGNVTSGSWLLNNDVPSNITGIPFGLLGGNLLQVWAASQNVDTYDIGLYWHLGDEIGLTLLATMNIVAERQDFFGIPDFGTVPVPSNVQIAVRISNGAAKNPKASVFIGGA